jgi:purine-binding chemotaxis protein CheW
MLDLPEQHAATPQTERGTGPPDACEGSAASADLAGRFEALERELALLRRLLAGRRAMAPALPFEALELILDASTYLVPVGCVQRVVQVPWAQPVPDAPEWLRGTVALGADLVPMLDLRRRFGGPRTALTPDGVVAVVDGPPRLALLVDAVGDLVPVAPEDLQPALAELAAAPFLLGSVSRDGDARHVLDVAALVHWVPGDA